MQVYFPVPIFQKHEVFYIAKFFKEPRKAFGVENTWYVVTNF